MKTLLLVAWHTGHPRGFAWAACRLGPGSYPVFTCPTALGQGLWEMRAAEEPAGALEEPHWEEREKRGQQQDSSVSLPEWVATRSPSQHQHNTGRQHRALFHWLLEYPGVTSTVTCFSYQGAPLARSTLH